jgi:hypothetical protein
MRRPLRDKTLPTLDVILGPVPRICQRIVIDRWQMLGTGPSMTEERLAVSFLTPCG